MLKFVSISEGLIMKVMMKILKDFVIYQMLVKMMLIWIRMNLSILILKHHLKLIIPQ